ncbi:hypothetical protein ZOD2009_14481 [Haladaptatus paucihalophilus DX253]|uniref:Uncharacterized protein n=1 Tax=Haladaptatus paucihalophilus DX253 TaxID=797209 RepID=E7QVR0_HALPU|nr:hypothetical protein [Haladaptatus paucihalophilus]EFW91323.1 hypothetical protein ZOD2009_14481 [Haladaptatus paucihalophilus DX253]SHL10738.1 hypothetical protein SAMN05444342_3046 [Haladaptatus paucihalophilus DX253]
MNHHEFLDVATVTASGLVLRDATFFARSLDGPRLDETVVETRLALDEVETSGHREVTVATPAGGFRGAYCVWQWYGDDAPTLIFHHGSGEDPFDFGRFSSNSARRLFAAEDWSVPVNVILVRAPFHDRSSFSYARAMGALSNFVGMCAASTAMVEALTAAVRERGSPAVTVSGISLGGWVTNLHRSFHGTADRYAPIFAGAALGEMFATSAYRRMTAARARTDPDRLRDVLDFERAFRAATADCRPLLARYDRIIELDAQRSGYDGIPLTVIETGHVTGSLAASALREHVRTALDRPAARE